MDKKEAIRKAAAKIIAREGFSNTKMQAIADEAGIAVGSIYNYFKSKDEVLDYIFVCEHSRILKILEKLLKKEEPFDKLLEEFITIYIERAKDEPYVTMVLIQEGLAPLTCKSKGMKASLARVKEALCQFIQKGQNQGYVNKRYNIEFITEILFYTLRSLTTAIYNKTDNIDLEEAKKQAIYYIVNGLK